MATEITEEQWPAFRGANQSWANRHQGLVQNAPPGAVEDYPGWANSAKGQRYRDAGGEDFRSGADKRRNLKLAA